jgi:hypothetical protein
LGELDRLESEIAGVPVAAQGILAR